MKAAIVERFGESVLDPDGEIDRASVGAIVFADRSQLAWLEALLHSRVVTVVPALAGGAGERPDPPGVCATEVPLLYETGGRAASTPSWRSLRATDVRTARTIVPDLTLREERLLPDEEKLRRADFAYVNDGTLEELDEFVADVIAKLSK